MDRPTRQTQREAARALRAEGQTWAEIAAALRARWPELTARAAMRIAHGWTQRQAADEWTTLWPDQPKTDKDVGLWELRRPGFSVLHKLARLYQCSVADLVADLADYRHLDQPAAVDRLDPSDSTALEVHSLQSGVVQQRHGGGDGDDEEVDRREFTLAGVVAAISLPLTVRELLSPPPSGAGRVSMDDVDAIRAFMEDSRLHDATFGGGSACDVAAAVHAKATAWLQWRGQPRPVAEALQLLVGDLGAWVGWLAYDAGRLGIAQRYLHETIIHARLVDYPAVEVRAMACLCLLLNRRGRPAEALQSAQAAERIAEPWATPQLRSLLMMRAASAHARLGAPAAFAHELARAERALDADPADSETATWTSFVTHREIIGLAGDSCLTLGQADEAAAAFRQVTTDPDPAYQRNSAFYTVQLAHATAQQGDLAGAAEIGTEALPVVTSMQSARTRRALRQLRMQLDSHRAVAAVDDFAEAYDQEIAR